VLSYILYGLSKIVFIVITGAGKATFQYPAGIFKRGDKEKDNEEE